MTTITITLKDEDGGVAMRVTTDDHTDNSNADALAQRLVRRAEEIMEEHQFFRSERGEEREVNVATGLTLVKP